MTDHTITEEQLPGLLRGDMDEAGTVHLVGLADQALRQARRRSRARTGMVGLAVAAVAVTSIGWMGWIGGTRMVGPAAGNGTVRTGLQVSFLPVVSVKPGACPVGGGYPSADGVRTASCYQLDRAKGLTPTAPRAVATLSQTADAWEVDLTLYGKDVPALAALTAVAADKSAPRNELAVVIEGKVLSAPMVSASITGGHLQLSGDFTKQSATDLAEQLNGR